jgi:rhamnose utilization protein RhaD (predicted bifunctional aldolase and dehydrogenase)
MGEFVEDHAKASGLPRFGGPLVTTLVDRESIAATLLPYLRGAVSSNRRVIAHFDLSDDALEFANSRWAGDLSRKHDSSGGAGSN